jgi:hypothetical protein
MRPKFIFLILVLVECFLLVMIAAPGVVRPQRLEAAQREYSQSHTAEAAQKVHDEQARARKFQVFLLIAAVVVLVGMIVYALYRKL